MQVLSSNYYYLRCLVISKESSHQQDFKWFLHEIKAASLSLENAYCGKSVIAS